MTFYNRLKEDTKELRNATNDRHLYRPKNFSGSVVSYDIIIKCFDFAYTMAKDSFHRSKRSGGTHQRSPLELFWDTFRGKIAECIAYDYFASKNYEVSDLDFSIYPRGVWDSFDMRINGEFISIKSTKHFGQLLLLETADWDEQGRYLPDADKNIPYSYFLLVRTKIENENHFTKGNLPEYDLLKNFCLSMNIEGELTGVLSHQDFVNQIIKYRFIIKKGQLLQGRVRMDADNYYTHAINLESPEII